MRNVIPSLFLSLSFLLFCSCGNKTSSSFESSSSTETNFPSSTVSSIEPASSIEESTLAELSLSSSQEESSNETSSVESSSVGPKSGDIDFYALNDFHGSCIVNGNEAGIVKVGSFFKEKRKEENTVLLNSGDMFQGSIESNLNHGEMLTKIMNDIQFDCFTLGNHEFDWGVNYISANRQLKDETTQYQTPFLAANIYNYDLDTDTVGDYASLGEKYTIKTLANGLKVGIIGCIGTNQITSITSAYVDDLTFIDPISVTKTLSDELRTKQNCDVVVLDFHADQDDALNQGLTDISPNSNKRYVDAVFCGHSHQLESSLENGVPFVQGSCNGKAYSQVKLHVASDGSVTCTNYSTPSTATISIQQNDADIENTFSTYKAISDTLGQETLTTLNGSFESGTSRNEKANGTYISTFATEAIGWACQQSGNDYDIDYAVCNTGRDSLSSGDVTYAKLFKSLPFDNEIEIIQVKGSELKNELKYNQFTRYDSAALDDSSLYTVAVIDYLATHRNASRQYDYFPTLTTLGELSDNGNTWNYREITAAYMKTFSSITTSDYSNALAKHSYSKLSSSL